jgi:tRNA pseudouridine32 synthase/23S rRNA pseudouridine746 synthase/23S rRNA pseudouridine1911/1915/1917 synthase
LQLLLFGVIVALSSRRVSIKKIPKKYQPQGFEILHEDPDLIVGSKAAGYLTVGALWNRDHTVHSALNQYVRKGNPKSRKCVYVVHRLDQATSGILIFAKTEEVQYFLKENWKSTTKIYYAIVHGKLEKKSGKIESYLQEDEDYFVHSSSDHKQGKLAQTEYAVLKETGKFSLLRINLLTGKKNQIRVHLAAEGHPLVGDAKYGKNDTTYKNLALHSASIELTHPFSKKRMKFEAQVPAHFRKLVDYNY